MTNICSKIKLIPQLAHAEAGSLEVFNGSE